MTVFLAYIVNIVLMDLYSLYFRQLSNQHEPKILTTLYNEVGIF